MSYKFSVEWVSDSCCVLCQHGHEFGSFPNQGKLWGRCDHPEMEYDHGKHSGTMQMGILAIGSCALFELYDARPYHWFGAYKEFVETDDGTS
jgi:hypothetical protein